MKYLLIGLLFLCNCTSIYCQTAMDYANKAWTKRQNKDYAGAMEEYNKAIELQPKKYNYYAGRADVKSELQDFRGAISDYHRAIELNPATDLPVNLNHKDSRLYTGTFNLYYSYHGLAYAYSRIGKEKEAIKYYTKAIEYGPKNANSFYLRGISKGVLGDINGACMDWSKAGELGEDKAYDFIRKYCNN